MGDAVDRLAAEWGRIDVLFNDAGVHHPRHAGTRCRHPRFAVPGSKPARALPVHETRHPRSCGGREAATFSTSRPATGKSAWPGSAGIRPPSSGSWGSGKCSARELAAQGIKVADTVPRLGEYRHGLRRGLRPSPGKNESSRNRSPRPCAGSSASSPSVSIMEVLLECTADVERRATGELHALYALRGRRPDLDPCPLRRLP